MTSTQQIVTNRRNRESAERQAKRDQLRDQIACGKLKVRKATAAEMRRFRQERDAQRGIEP